jgi:hypothetical protein
MPITNTAKKHDETIEGLRGAIEHRAMWMYLLMDEARKKGLEWDDFARQAILRCGRFHGTTKFPRTDSLLSFGRAFAGETLKKVFDMNVVEMSEEKFMVELSYCPLVTGWLKQTDNEEDVAHLCDIAMDGDRGIIETYPRFEFDLQSTIAAGAPVCRIVISKK